MFIACERWKKKREEGKKQNWEGSILSDVHITLVKWML
jgi:hypothetical protein